MLDFFQNYIPATIQYALVLFTINSLMSLRDMNEFYGTIVWYSIKCSATLHQTCQSFKKLLKYSGIITNKHRIEYISNGKNMKIVTLYDNNISEKQIQSLKHYDQYNIDLILYTAPVNDDTNKCDIIVADSISNIIYPPVPAKNQIYSLAISWPTAADNDSAVDNDSAADNDVRICKEKVGIFKKIEVELPYNFCIEGNKLFTEPFMMWLFEHYNVPHDKTYVRDYTITFFDNTMTPYVITRKNNILVENNLFKIIDIEKNDSDTDDSIDSTEQQEIAKSNNWYDFFY